MPTGEFVKISLHRIVCTAFHSRPLSNNNIPQKQPGNTFMTGKHSCHCKRSTGQEYSFWLVCSRSYKDHAGTEVEMTNPRMRKGLGDNGRGANTEAMKKRLILP